MNLTAAVFSWNLLFYSLGGPAPTLYAISSDYDVLPQPISNPSPQHYFTTPMDVRLVSCRIKGNVTRYGSVNSLLDASSVPFAVPLDLYINGVFQQNLLSFPPAPIADFDVLSSGLNIAIEDTDDFAFILDLRNLLVSSTVPQDLGGMLVSVGFQAN